MRKTLLYRLAVKRGDIKIRIKVIIEKMLEHHVLDFLTEGRAFNSWGDTKDINRMHATSDNMSWKTKMISP